MWGLEAASFVAECGREAEAGKEAAEEGQEKQRAGARSETEAEPVCGSQGP